MAGKVTLKATREDGVEMPTVTADQVDPSQVPPSIPYDPMTGAAPIASVDQSGQPAVSAADMDALISKLASTPGGADKVRAAFGFAAVAPTAPITTIPGFEPGKTVNVITDRNQILIGLEKARLLGDIDRNQYNELSYMKEVLEAEEQRVFFVNPDPMNPKMRVVEASLNGYKYLIPVGQPVAAPQSIFEIMLRAGLAEPQRPEDLPRCPRVAPAVRAALERQALSEESLALARAGLVRP